VASRNPKSTQINYRWNLAAGVGLLALAALAWLSGLLLDDLAPASLGRIVRTFAVLGVVPLLVFVVEMGLSTLEARGLLSRHRHEVAYRSVQLAAVVVAAATVAVRVWEFAVGDVLLGAGVMTVLVAVAARRTLESVLSGLIIMSTDVFRVGDWVRIDERFGRIEHISLFNTQILSPQGEIHVFPNEDIIGRDITNLGRGRYRNDVLVGVDYGTDVTEAISLCNAVLSELTEERENHVDGFNPTSIKSFDDSQITLAVKIWIREPTPVAINEAQTTVLAALHDRFRDEGIEIPFPQRTVSERKHAGPRP